jgi:hypothetical protein
MPQVELPRRRPARSPFENSILPGFTEWLIAQVERRAPDLFVPVEMKGALLLAAADKYATEVLGTPLHVPVLYRTALAYYDPEHLAGLRTEMLDDAIGSGNTGKWHRQRVEQHGVRQVEMLACIGKDTGGRPADRYTDDDGSDGEERGDQVKCFRLVDERRYRELLWQIAEFVVARGLPPEVDHHVFDLRLDLQIADAWPLLADRLRRLGKLSVDGPTTTNGDVISMTLHFPTLPSARRHPLHGAVRDEGVKKLRLFADLAHETIHVVPMAFPALDLDDATVDHVEESVARELAADWTEQDDDVARLLLDRARTFSPELLFRIISAATETDMIFAFAGELAAAMPGSIESFAADRELFGRLYGPEVGGELADRVDSGIMRAVATTPIAATSVAAAAPHSEPAPFLRVDEKVRWATREIAEHLTWLYRARASEDEFDPTTRVGLSLTELERDAAFGRLDPLTLSRCFDFGLAMTTLVPYTDVVQREDGRVEVRRRYRVSETRRANPRRKFEDAETKRQELDEETVALIARNLAGKVEQWNEGVPLVVVERVAALLTTVVNADGGVGLAVEATRDGMQVRLGGHQPKTLRTVTSENFDVIGETIRPSKAFDEMYDAQELLIDGVRATKMIEGHLNTIAPSLATATDGEALLHRWSLSAQPHMGLEVVEQHLRDALGSLVAPLKRLAVGTVPDPKLVHDVVERGREFARAAQDAVDALTDGDARALHEGWRTTDRYQSDLRDALITPSVPTELLALADQTVGAVHFLAELTERIEHWLDEGAEDDSSLPVELNDACEDLELKLSSLVEPGTRSAPPEGREDRRVFVGERMKGLNAMLMSRAAALNWNYRVLRKPAPEPGEARRITVLAADMSGSTKASVRNTHDAYRAWTRDCLNLCVQWGAAFGGEEISRREGDAVFIEFDDVDHAVLCAAVIQQHTKALRNTGRRAPHWRLRLSVDQGELSVGDNNALSSALNVASKLCDAQKDDESCVDRALLTPDAKDAASPAVREHLCQEQSTEIVIDPEPDLHGLDAGKRFLPFAVDAEAAVQALLGAPGEQVPVIARITAARPTSRARVPLGDDAVGIGSAPRYRGDVR